MTGLAFFGAFSGALTAVMMVALLLRADAGREPPSQAAWCVLDELGQPVAPDLSDPLPIPMEAERDDHD